MTPPRGSNTRRRALLALVFQYYFVWPGEQPPHGWADAVEHVAELQAMADLPALRDLDRIIAEGAHVFSSRLIGRLR